MIFACIRSLIIFIEMSHDHGVVDCVRSIITILGAMARFGQGAVNMWTTMTVHRGTCLLTRRTRTLRGPITKIGNCERFVERFSFVMHEAPPPDLTQMPRSAKLTAEAWRPQTLSQSLDRQVHEFPLPGAAGNCRCCIIYVARR